MIELLGYAPDLASNTPGVLTNCVNLVPSLKGMKGAPSPRSTGLPALDKASRGAAALTKLDGSTRVIVGTEDSLYEAGSSSYTDVSDSGGYTLGAESTWRFAQLGDVSLAVAKTQILQESSGSTFGPVHEDAPAAAIVEVVNGFTFLFDVHDQGSIYDSADRPHGWWAARDKATWTPSVANEAYSGDLTSTPGPITAGKRFGQSVIAYKSGSMYQGGYVGELGWEFSLIPGEAGALSQESVVDVGTPENPVHIFMGSDNFWRFDGSRPVPIGSPVKETVFRELNISYAKFARALHDKASSTIRFYYSIGSSRNSDRCVVYNYRTNKWGRDDREIQACLNYVSAGITYNDLGNYYSNYNDLPNSSYDTAFFSASRPLPAIFNASNLIQTLDGESISSSMTTWDDGADEFVSFLSRVQPLFLTKPQSASMTNYYRDSLGDPLIQDGFSVMDAKGRFDIENGGRSANWHRASFEFMGDVEMPSLNAEIAEDGLE